MQAWGIRIVAATPAYLQAGDLKFAGVLRHSKPGFCPDAAVSDPKCRQILEDSFPHQVTTGVILRILVVDR